MKLLIVSDSHGQTRKLAELLARRRGQDDALLFLGDGCADAERLAVDYPTLSLFAVAGNCDPFLSPGRARDEELLLSLGGKTLLLMHGHRFAVGAGFDLAAAHARALGADILLFGHTHVRLEKHLPGEGEERPLWIFNPGSISRPRDGAPSFGTLELRENGVLFGHGFL